MRTSAETSAASAPPGQAPRQAGYVLACVAIVVFAVLTLSGPNGVRALMEKHREIRQLEVNNAALAAENKVRREKIERLENNSDEQGLEIRKQRKMVRPGEKTFVIQDQPGDDPSTSGDQ